MKRKIKYLYQLLILLVLKFKKFKPSESIIVCSAPRGGSTWLMEVLDSILPTSINWEPLHENWGIVPNSVRGKFKTVFNNPDSFSDFHTFFDEIHSFKRYNLWTTKYLSLTKVFNSKFVLTKYVRANMLLPLILEEIEFVYKPIYLLRHPIDTCISQLKTFEKIDKSEIRPLLPNYVDDEKFNKHLMFLESLESELEIKIAIWCIINCYTLKNINHSKVCIVLYSDILQNPEQEIKRILNSLSLNKYSNNLNTTNFRKASKSDFNCELKNSPLVQLNKNIDKLDLDTKNKIQSIFDYFDFKLYNAFTSRPNKQYLFELNESLKN